MAKELLIKGMVCSRCISVLKTNLEQAGFGVKAITLGRVAITAVMDEQDQQRLQALLSGLGFELLIDKQTLLVGQIKEIVHDTIDSMVARGEAKLKLSTMLTDKINMTYAHLSEAFSRAEGITLEQYAIKRRIEKVKQLLQSSESSISEIAFLTGFSSVQYFSKQFKDLTGMPPAAFRREKAGLPVF